MQVENLRTTMDVIVAKNRHGSEGTERQRYWAEVDLIADEVAQ